MQISLLFITTRFIKLWVKHDSDVYFYHGFHIICVWNSQWYREKSIEHSDHCIQTETLVPRAATSTHDTMWKHGYKLGIVVLPKFNEFNIEAMITIEVTWWYTFWERKAFPKWPASYRHFISFANHANCTRTSVCSHLCKPYVSDLGYNVNSVTDPEGIPLANWG